MYLIRITIGIGLIVIAANTAVLLCRGKPNRTADAKPTASKSAFIAHNRSTLARVARCFHIGDNLHELYHHRHSARNVAELAGIRSTVCMWVLVFHVNYHSAFTLSNLVQLVVKMEWFSYQPVFQAFLYVDVFFVLR